MKVSPLLLASPPTLPPQTKTITMHEQTAHAQAGLGLAAVGLLTDQSDNGSSPSLVQTLFGDMASPEPFPSSLLLVTGSSGGQKAHPRAGAIGLLDGHGDRRVAPEAFARACGGEIRAVMLGIGKCYLSLAAESGESEEGEGWGGEERGASQQEEQRALSRYVLKYTRRDQALQHDIGWVGFQ